MDVKVSASVFRRVITAHYFDFHGRASRDEFWHYIVVFLAITIIAGILVHVFAIAAVQILFTAWFIGGFLPTVGVAIRRLHDLDLSGWLLVTPLVPGFLWLLLLFSFWLIPALLVASTLGAIGWLLYLCLQPGMSGDNRYGHSPG